MMSAVTFLTLGALLARTNEDRRVRIYFMTLAVLLTMLIGVSRIYSRACISHPTCSRAWCLGTAWALLCWIVALFLQRSGQVEPATPCGRD